MMILDLIGAYLAHYFQHKIKILWLIHAVHHSDKHVDTTTANRHHPIESVVRFIVYTFCNFYFRIINSNSFFISVIISCFFSV